MNMLRTREDSLRESFNSQNFATEEKDIPFSIRNLQISNKFLFYFMQILQFAFEMEMISEQQRNSLASALGEKIEELAEGKPVKASNCLYVITLWLQSMSNWEAWIQLSNVEMERAANNLLTSAYSWFFKKLNEIEDQLKSSRSNVIALKDRSIRETFSFLEQEIKTLKKLDDVDLKSLHQSPVAVDYNFLDEVEAPNYLKRLERTIQFFAIEVSILTKIDAKSILRRKRQELQKVSKKETEKVLDLQRELDRELASLKKEYEKRKNTSIESQKAYEKALMDLEATFAKKHPQLGEEELEEAFDEYLDSLPEDFFGITYEDLEEIKEWYSEEKELLFKKYEERGEQQESQESEKEIALEESSLTSLIKEFAIFSLAQRQVIAYPSTLEERSKALKELSLKIAIPIFIKEMKVSFSDLEIAYLKAAMK